MVQEIGMKLPTLICDRYLLSPTVIDGRISEVFKGNYIKCLPLRPLPSCVVK